MIYTYCILVYMHIYQNQGIFNSPFYDQGPSQKSYHTAARGNVTTMQACRF